MIRYIVNTIRDWLSPQYITPGWRQIVTHGDVAEAHTYPGDTNLAKVIEISNSQSRFYGGDNTIHHTGHLDVETRDGEVVAVWYRCQMLPFEQEEVDDDRARSMRSAMHHPAGPYGMFIEGIELSDTLTAE